MTQVEAVVFDIGNVLIEWNPERHYDRRIGRETRERLFAEVDLHAMNLEVDRGADFRASVQGLAAQHPDWHDEIMIWHDDWLEMASPAIPHAVRLLQALRARNVPVFALTNFGNATFDIARAAYPFLEDFDRHYVSAEMELIKPDPNIYAVLEADCGVAPENLLFTDDRPENIDAARARGWQTHLFDGAAGWALALTSAGVLSEKEAR